MAARRLVSLVLLLTALPGHQCFQFERNPADGATLKVSQGDDVTIPWVYTPNSGDVISGINWFFRGGSEELVAMFTHSMFMALPAFSGRVQQANNGGLTLKHVTLGDSGMYSVEVTGQDANGVAFTSTRSVNLYVSGFQWQGNTADGETRNVTQGSDVTIPWTFTTDGVISSVTWFFQVTSEQIVAEFTHNQFFVVPAFSGRVQKVTNGGITLKHVTVSDSGTYTVEVTGHDVNGSAFTQRRSLTLQVNVVSTQTTIDTYPSDVVSTQTTRATYLTDNYSHATSSGNDPSDKSTFHDTGHLLWRDCGAGNAWFRITQFDLTPSPLHFPSSGTITLHADNIADDQAFFDEGVTLNAMRTNKKHLHGRWADIQCAGPGGCEDSITRSSLFGPLAGFLLSGLCGGECSQIQWDPCYTLKNAFGEGHCPPMYSQMGLTCSCPSYFHINQITLNATSERFTLPDMSYRPTFFTTGEYYIKTDVQEPTPGSDVSRMCLEFYINIVVE